MSNQKSNIMWTKTEINKFKMDVIEAIENGAVGTLQELSNLCYENATAGFAGYAGAFNYIHNITKEYGIELDHTIKTDEKF